MSVDPLVEITMSPYAYTWNDPVNYADPTGMIGERIGGPNDPPGKRGWVKRAIDWLFGRKPKNSVTIGKITSSFEPDQSTQTELPWYLNESKYGGGKPLLTLGLHNIKIPYVERSEYGEDILENGDTFLKNTFASAYNGIASTWNDGMEGKAASSMVFEGDRDMESTVRRITRGNATTEEFEGIAAAVILHKVSKTPTEGKVVGLGLDEDLYRHRGTGAITWEDAKWQKEGLTTVRWERVVMDKSNFKSSFREVVENASAIRFDVTNFNPSYHKPGITNYEFNYILSNPALLQKTTFIKNGNVVNWNGTEFINK